MKNLSIKLENCYGIKKFEQVIDFSKGNSVIIYAPNGVMKSSFAQTFQDIQNEEKSRDRIFPARSSVSDIVDETKSELSKEKVFVVKPYDEEFKHSAKTSTLLVNSKLRIELEQLNSSIDSLKSTFINALKDSSKSKKDLEKEVSSTFTSKDDEFYRALKRIREEVLQQTDAPFSDIEYDRIFDDKIVSFLDSPDISKAIREYIDKYNELLAASTYFKKGVFNYHNGSTIAKSLADNGFFEANHSVTFNSATPTEITSKADLEALIEDEKSKILNNSELKKKYDGFEKKMNKNEAIRNFADYLDKNEKILPQLGNLKLFKEELLKSYIHINIDLYKTLLDQYEATEKRRTEIENTARSERTQWESVISFFNRRFFVPFTLEAKNRVAVILGQEPVLTLDFTFTDGVETASVDKDSLMKSLSTGEKKALYILNIIFEIEARKRSKQETLFIVDDIADSFDYKNKYAIIEYLREAAQEPYFNQILLTHNFDFFRTVSSRFIHRSNCFMASKTSTAITIERAEVVNNIFVNSWKPKFHNDSKKRIASIPFIRNLIEYMVGVSDANYTLLTSLLHWKSDTEKITQKDLERVFNEVFKSSISIENDKNITVLSLLESIIPSCLTASDGINFENKIILSIAIRLFAEKYMVSEINDATLIAGISSSQTGKLFEEYKARFPSSTETIGVLSRVILMTPETIHVNSFMYEPILDMSDEHLRDLYREVVALK